MGNPIPTLLLVILGFASVADSYASSRVPASQPAAKESANGPLTYQYQCRKPPVNPEPVPEVKEDPNAPVTYLNQSDAYATAAEQASFLALYQKTMGPYGELQNPEERQKLISETAEAIDECVKNSSSCNEEKQKKVLKALVQLNQGLEIRCMMLANSNNKERMKSISPEDNPVRPFNQYLGTEYDYTKKDKSWKFEKTKVTKEMGRTAGVPDNEYFQLDENKARRTILSKEQEILGENFIREYGIFVDNYTNTQREDGARYYKFVPVGEAAYIYQNDEAGNRIIDQEKFEAAMREHSSPGVQNIVKDYKERIAKAKPIFEPPKKPGADGPEGRAKVDPGLDFSEVGMGFNPPQIPTVENVSYDDLKKDGKLDEEGKAKAAVRLLNDRFREAAAESKARALASADPNATGKSEPAYTHITMNPADFDKFLDDIWPSAARREQIRKGTLPPAAE